MQIVVFEVTRKTIGSQNMDDQEEAENIVDLLNEALGYPDTILFEAKVIRREDDAP
jgi:hypothetical protein